MAKYLKITKSEIRVTPNQYIAGGYYFMHAVYGILPGCKKTVKLSESPYFAKIHVRPLFGGNGEASIHPAEWAELIRTSPVVTELPSLVELTPELVAKAKGDALSRTTCPAITDRTYVPPGYTPTYDALVDAR
jgi:hypothetical protein